MCPPAYGSKDLQARRRPGTKLDLLSPPGPSNNIRKATHKATKKENANPPFIVHLSPQFFVLSLSLAAAFAFSFGAISRLILFSNLGVYVPDAPVTSPIDDSIEATNVFNNLQLPSPTVAAGKDVPFTTFATKVFESDGAIAAHTIHLDRREDAATKVEEEGNGEEEEEDEENAISEDELHLPAGQHLLVDIKNVDPTFLNSEIRLAEAMIELVNESKLTLLSYHCHTLVPMGVSCAGVLLESHVAFHTWPKEGVIAMDLFTCGAGLLIPVLPMIKELFGVPTYDEFGQKVGPEPAMLWSHKLRGFRQGFSPNYKRHENPLDVDLGGFVSRHNLDMKDPLVSAETEFQHVDVYEMIDPRETSVARSLASYERSLSGDGSYESLHKDMYRPEKVLFLDGVQQSSLYGEAAYHEALVHPALISHPNPRRVAIIGGGEGATLREVLKHNTVDEVKMVEIDEELVELCRDHMPEWSDCTDIAGSNADSCFDDSRASVAFEDAFKWFMDSFGKEKIEEEKFDVIIMDALDPDQFVEIVGNLYKDNKFVDALFNGLTDNGVFVIQLGEADKSGDPGEDMGQSQDVADMRKGLQSVGFESMHMYDEGHSHFFAPWSYLVCFKDSRMRARWYMTSSEVEIELHRRLHRTRSGKPSLSFFDGSTMAGYQVPHKAFETVYCRSEAEPWECDKHRGIDPSHANVPTSHLVAQKSTVGDFAGRGLFAATDIAIYSTFDIGESVKAFQISPTSWSIIEDLCERAENDENYGHVEEELSSVSTFVDGYGYFAVLLGKKHATVDAGITTFCNHGCNGSYSYGDEEADFTEMNVSLDHAQETLLNQATEVYSPVMERHLRQVLTIGDYTLRDIRKGEEILCDYLGFVGDPNDWEEDVTSLRGQCSGEMMGDVAEYEFEADHYEFITSGNSSEDSQFDVFSNEILQEPCSS